MTTNNTPVTTLSDWIDNLLWGRHVDRRCVRQIVRNTPEQFHIEIYCYIDDIPMFVSIAASVDKAELEVAP